MLQILEQEDELSSSRLESQRLEADKPLSIYAGEGAEVKARLMELELEREDQQQTLLLMKQMRE